MPSFCFNLAWFIVLLNPTAENIAEHSAHCRFCAAPARTGVVDPLRDCGRNAEVHRDLYALIRKDRNALPEWVKSVIPSTKYLRRSR